jgi:hypothetical protein
MPIFAVMTVDDATNTLVVEDTTMGVQAGGEPPIRFTVESSLAAVVEIVAEEESRA